MISVITAAYQDWPGLQRAMASLEAQTHRDWQHVVVADGPDPHLRQEMRKRGYRGNGKRVFCELGRNWHGFLGGDAAGQPPGSPGARGARGSRGVSAYLTATYLAGGDWISYLDQDCVFREEHLERCWEALQRTDADFAYTRMRRYLDGQPWDVVGNGLVGYGMIDGNMVVHKAELLRQANWRWGGDADWDLIGRWAAAGARAEFVPAITVHWHHRTGDV